MHRLVHAQAFGVRPVQAASLCPGISDGRSSVVNSTNVAFGVGSARLITAASGMPTHGNHHRPRFDAAQAVDALLEVERLDQILEVIVAGLLHRPSIFTVHGLVFSCPA